jgi:hypothetical protein
LGQFEAILIVVGVGAIVIRSFLVGGIDVVLTFYSLTLVGGKGEAASAVLAAD